MFDFCICEKVNSLDFSNLSRCLKTVYLVYYSLTFDQDSLIMHHSVKVFSWKVCTLWLFHINLCLHISILSSTCTEWCMVIMVKEAGDGKNATGQTCHDSMPVSTPDYLKEKKFPSKEGGEKTEEQSVENWDGPKLRGHFFRLLGQLLC